MATPSRRKSERFRWWNSERSGFQFGFQPTTSYPNAYTREAGRPVSDKGSDVSPAEFDTPPLSKISLGGEGDIGDGERDNSVFVGSNAYIIPPESTKVIVYTTSQPIAWNDKPWTYISGSNINVTSMSTPQITSAYQGKQITLLCIGSSITFFDSSGLALYTSRFVMDSGAILNLFYSATDNLWHETSRSHLTKDYGRF
jgi:hypothetical protein